MLDKPEVDFRELAGAALHSNAGIDAEDHLRAAHAAAGVNRGPALVKAKENEIMYMVTFDFPNASLPMANNFAVLLGLATIRLLCPT